MLNRVILKVGETGYVSNIYHIFCHISQVNCITCFKIAQYRLRALLYNIRPFDFFCCFYFVHEIAGKKHFYLLLSYPILGIVVTTLWYRCNEHFIFTKSEQFASHRQIRNAHRQIKIHHRCKVGEPNVHNMNISPTFHRVLSCCKCPCKRRRTVHLLRRWKASSMYVSFWRLLS